MVPSGTSKLTPVLRPPHLPCFPPASILFCFHANQPNTSCETQTPLLLISSCPPHPDHPSGRGQDAGVPHISGLDSRPPLPRPALQHYSRDKGAICTKLVKPKRKPGAKSAEEELAKGRCLCPLHPHSPPWGVRALGPGMGPMPQHLSMAPCLALRVEGLGCPGVGQRALTDTDHLKIERVPTPAASHTHVLITLCQLSWKPGPKSQPTTLPHPLHGQVLTSLNTLPDLTPFHQTTFFQGGSPPSSRPLRLCLQRQLSTMVAHPHCSPA